MTLGGRRVAVSRPRVRSVEGKELPVATYEYFADRDPLQRAVMDRMLAGVSTRKFARVGEPVGEQVEQTSSSKGKSTVSEMFIEKTRTALEELMDRRLDDVRLAVMMLDGLEIADRTHVDAGFRGLRCRANQPEGKKGLAARSAPSARAAAVADRRGDPALACSAPACSARALRRSVVGGRAGSGVPWQRGI
jgi:putative transposase